MKTSMHPVRLLRFPLAALATAAALIAAPAGAQLTDAEVRCRDAASRVARGAMATALQVRVNCVRRTAFGSFDPSINCMEDPEELGGPGTGDLQADRRLQLLAFSGERAGEVLSRRCLNDDNPLLNVLPSDVDLDDACSPASDDWADVGQCLVDIGMETAKIFMPALNLPGPGPLAPSALACMDAINAQARRTIGAQARFRSLCFRDDDKKVAGALDCGATIMPPGTVETTLIDKYDKRIGEVFPKLARDIEEFCDIPLATTGYDQITPDVTGGRFEGRITVWDIQEHLNDRLAEAVHAVIFGDTGVEALFLGAQTGGFCGDGSQQGGEQCDDGNNFSCDGCDRDCTLPVCGNGAICDDEECDDGNDFDADNCSNSCVSRVCGNGVTNPGWDEDCDDVGFSATCDDDCTFALCGDALVNNPSGETCDEGTGLPNNQALNTPTCDSNCSAPACPDGHHNPLNTNAPAPGSGEECDTGGNSLSCDANCTIASCGDGWTNPVRGEQCDDSNFSDTDDCPSSSTVPGSFCRTAFCGDGFQCTGGGCSSPEFCDDGTGSLGSSESADCDDDCSAVVCGDSNVNTTSGEQCDAGASNSDTRTCTAGCQTAVCGDGLTCSHASCTTGQGGTPEGCDDADGENNDPCRNDCELASCGDGVLCNDPTCATGPGGGIEQCDTSGQSATCDSDCSTAGCGDSQFNLSAGEQCDTGGNSATCDANCTFPACPDGTVNPAAGEECDDNNASNNDRCINSCDAAFCGDGLTCNAANCTSGPGGGVEQCDGNGESFGCDADCSNASCGDGQTNATRGEDCDDAGETFACDANCTTAGCGDGTVNATRGEVCDDGMDNGNGPGFCLADCSAVE